MNGAHFYAQVAGDQAVVALQDQLKKSCSTNGTGPFEPKAGTYCCARFTVDNEWYRAKVVNKAGGEFTVFFIDYGNTDVWYWNDFAYNKQLENDINYYSQRHLPLNLDLEWEAGEAGNESAWHTDMSDDGKVIIKVRKNPLGTSSFGPMEGAWYRLLVRGDNMDSWTGYREDL